jgi:hypothetical protein
MWSSTVSPTAIPDGISTARSRARERSRIRTTMLSQRRVMNPATKNVYAAFLEAPSDVEALLDGVARELGLRR